jgi:hypothetical protein
MKAAVSRSFGPPDVVTVTGMPRPEPRDDEILVRVRAAAVGVMDGLARRGSPWYARADFGLLRPRFPVLGCDFAGQVEAAGPAVSRFGLGEAVFGTIAPRFGAHAEYICLPEHGAVAPKPANVSFAEAAALADATALCFLRDKAGLRSGQAVLLVRPLPPGAQPRRRVPDHRPLARDLRGDAVDGEARFAAGGAGVHRTAAGCGQAEGSAGHPGACRSVGAGSRGRRVLSAGPDRRRVPARRRGTQEGHHCRHHVLA